MGKATGFLEIDRQDRKYDAPAERLKHYREFVIPHDDAGLKGQAARCMNCGIPYCHNGCPVNNQIPDWNDLVYNDMWEEASRNLHSTNNFPEFTGRVCPAPCEASCTLNIEDSPVTIKTIECAIVDKAWENGWLKPLLAGAGPVTFDNGIIHAEVHDDLEKALRPYIDSVAAEGVRTIISIGGKRRGMAQAGNEGVYELGTIHVTAEGANSSEFNSFGGSTIASGCSVVRNNWAWASAL